LAPLVTLESPKHFECSFWRKCIISEILHKSIPRLYLSPVVVRGYEKDRESGGCSELGPQALSLIEMKLDDSGSRLKPFISSAI
jgi:hypothetical protein